MLHFMASIGPAQRTHHGPHLVTRDTTDADAGGLHQEFPMPPTTPPARKASTSLDQRIEAVLDRTVDQLQEYRDRSLLDDAQTQLVDAHRRLVETEATVLYYRDQLHGLFSGDYPVDHQLFPRVERSVAILKQAVEERADRKAAVLALLEPIETAARAQLPAEGVELDLPDLAALLEISRGAKLRQHLLTQQVSVVTASTRIPHSRFQRLEDAGLVARDTGHPLHAGQPITVTEAGRRALASRRRTQPAATAPVARPGAWPAAPTTRR